MSINSWWDLGEWVGFQGTDLALFRIPCPFCEEKGNFSIEHHAEKKKSNGRKILNFDTLMCGNCASYVLVFWSAGNSHHSFEMVPWPLKYTSYPEYWPEAVGRYWLQARKNLSDENWDAAVMMARTALQITLRDNGAQGKRLIDEINDLASKGILPPLMKEWSHEIRELGNNSTHPKPDQSPTDPKDARDIFEFLDFLLTYLYKLPKNINDYRERKNEK